MTVTVNDPATVPMPERIELADPPAAGVRLAGFTPQAIPAGGETDSIRLT